MNDELARYASKLRDRERTLQERTTFDQVEAKYRDRFAYYGLDLDDPTVAAAVLVSIQVRAEVLIEQWDDLHDPDPDVMLENFVEFAAIVADVGATRTAPPEEKKGRKGLGPLGPALGCLPLIVLAGCSVVG